MTAKGSTEVAIVGSGPVGMFLALDLARQGVRSLVIDPEAEARPHPKGSTHNARTMELYRRLGLADTLRSLGLPDDQPTDSVYLTQLGGYELGRIPMPSSREKIEVRDRREPLDQTPEPLHRVNQMYSEKAIHARLRAEPLAETLYGWTYLGSDAADGGFALRLGCIADGREAKVAARFVVGCDGARSTVRRELGTSYEGDDTFDKGFMGGPMRSVYVRIPDFYRRFVKQRGWNYWILRPDGVMSLVDVNGRDEFLFYLPTGEDSPDGEIAARLRSCSGEPFACEILATKPWVAGRAFVAGRYGGEGRYIAGDAAHLFTPTGGFGMNTGIDDAANLSWKFAAVLQGWGGPRLLESYEAERRPIGLRNTRVARQHALNLRTLPLSADLDRAGPEGDVARAAVGSVVPSLREEFASIGIQLGGRYDGSSLLLEEAGAVPPGDPLERYEASSVPGGRAPHLWLPDGSSLYDRFGAGFTLLRFDGGADAGAFVDAARGRALPLSVVDVDMPAARTLYPRKLALVRPDHYVAWRGDAASEPEAILARASGWA